MIEIQNSIFIVTLKIDFTLHILVYKQQSVMYYHLHKYHINHVNLAYLVV